MSQFNTRPRMGGLVAMFERYVALCSRVPHSLLALLGRFALAALFWKAGQTKVANFALDPFAGTWQIGWPRLAGKNRVANLVCGPTGLVLVFPRRLWR